MGKEGAATLDHARNCAGVTLGQPGGARAPSTRRSGEVGGQGPGLHHQDGLEGRSHRRKPRPLACCAPLLPFTPPFRAPPSPAGAPPRPLTAAGVVVGVADAEVAPAVLHAVAAVGALRVHVAGRGRDFCGERGSPVSSSWGHVLDESLAAREPVTAPGQPDQALLGQPLLGPLLGGLDPGTPVQVAAAI